MQINQTTQLKNMLAPLNAPGINVVSSLDGIIIAGAAIGIVVRREAKNRYHMTALCSDERVKSLERDYPNLGAAIECCVQLVSLDEKIKARQG